MSRATHSAAPERRGRTVASLPPGRLCTARATGPGARPAPGAGTDARLDSFRRALRPHATVDAVGHGQQPPTAVAAHADQHSRATVRAVLPDLRELAVRLAEHLPRLH